MFLDSLPVKLFQGDVRFAMVKTQDGYCRLANCVAFFLSPLSFFFSEGLGALRKEMDIRKVAMGNLGRGEGTLRRKERTRNLHTDHCWRPPRGASPFSLKLPRTRIPPIDGCQSPNGIPSTPFPPTTCPLLEVGYRYAAGVRCVAFFVCREPQPDIMPA